MITIRPVALSDHAAWSSLYAGYAEFYQVVQTPEMRATVWSWLHDSTHPVKGLIAETEGGEAIGLAHYRPYSRPLAASTGGFLDDLFVSPAGRGQEVGKQLIATIVDIGKNKGWTMIRWRTADDNYRARSAYDKVATRSQWLTYEIKL